MPGVTAWYGLNRIIEPKHGETVVVSAASGAVGSVVGQLAKIAGCRAIGIAGGAEKCAYVTRELQFDACIDYKSEDVGKRLKEVAPDGVDGYFENVGGEIMDAVLPRMNAFGRIALCGLIAGYDGTPIPIRNPAWFLVSRLLLKGFIVSEHMEVWPAALKELGSHVATGRIKYRETVANGIENAPQAFLGMLKGANFGKQLVKLDLMKDLNGKVAVITGAGSGFGREFARLGAREGMKLVLADVQREALDAVVAELGGAGAEVVGEVVDVADSGQVARLADRAFQAFGPVHLLMNNAGVGGGGYLWENTDKDWNWVLGVNLMGVVHGIQHFVPRMLEANRHGTPGHIVNTASMAGWLCRAADGRLQRLQARGRRADGDAVPRPPAGPVDDRRDGAVPRLRADRDRRLASQPSEDAR